jgi:hypothetical protein
MSGVTVLASSYPRSRPSPDALVLVWRDRLPHVRNARKRVPPLHQDEQAMVEVVTGLSRIGFIPSVSCRDFPIKEERSPHLWRRDRSNLVANQLPAGLRSRPRMAAAELAIRLLAAVFTSDGNATDRDCGVATVNAHLDLFLFVNGIERGRTGSSRCALVSTSPLPLMKV